MQDNPSAEISPVIKLLSQALFVFLSGLFLFLVLGLSSVLIDQVWYAGRVMPGISMNGVDLSGLDLGQAAGALSSGMDNYNKELTIQYEDISWPVLPSQLGLQLDAAASARAAFQYGRQGSLGSIIAYQFLGRRSSHDLQPIVTFNEKTALEYLSSVAREYDRPVVEAGLALNGSQVVATPGQVGQRLDLQASLTKIADHITRSDSSTIRVAVILDQPQIVDASPFAAQAQEILSSPFELVIPAGQPDAGRTFSISIEKMVPMLSFTRQQVNGQFVIQPQFRDDLLHAYLADLSSRSAIRPQNSRFIFNDDTRLLDLLTSAVTGRELNLSDSLTAIQTAISAHQNSAVLSFTNLAPEVTDASTSTELGITELVYEEHSYFFGSSEPRIQNIEKAASEFHGLLIAPGATFSMGANMGDISLDNGYSEALIIFNGRTIEGVGGGVCQVSTTLFRAAFFAGFPIEERHPHAYRVSYYEKTSGNGRNSSLAGLDATVFIPLVDLKFTNDTPYWLLMETYISRAANRITWKFYSTSDGRSVEWETTGPVNIVEPKKPLYKKNPDLNAGEIKQVDWEADGADVRVDRWVYRDGALIISDVFRTHYAPWRAIYEYGPGTDGIPDNGDD
jgi:vancomycin resistance protein YoaR